MTSPSKRVPVHRTMERKIVKTARRVMEMFPWRMTQSTRMSWLLSKRVAT
jgi:hypothetical protein